MATPYFSAPVVFTKPPGPGNDSYYDVLFNASTPLGASGTVLDGWCIQPFVRLMYENGNPYSGYGYAGYEVAADNAYQYAGSINWLLNYYREGNTGYTADDVQLAIWRLVAQVPDNTSALSRLATTHADFVPDVGQVLAVVIDPVTREQIHDQNVIVETRAAKLGDRVWHDADADGIQDAGEAGIAGVAVQLVRDANGDGIIGANEVVANTATDANGNYSFKGLTPGLGYQVRFSSPAGFDAASPRQADGNAASGANSDGALSDVVYLGAGEYNATIDSGFYKYAKLGDKVWNDSNGNGIQDAGESGKAGVVVNLYVCQDGTPAGFVASTVTGANGNYKFDKLVPGQYIVQFMAFDGSVATSANVGNDAFDSDVTAGGFTGCYMLASGETNNTVDAGFYKPATLGDRVWNDSNGNGVQDSGETGKAGVKVELYTCGVNDQPGALVRTQTTDANGNYSFSGLKPGDYMVKFIAADGSVLSTANVGNDALDSDAGSNGFTGCYTLTSGQTNTTVDAGFYKPATLGDRVWNDTNGNGVQDAGETGKAGVKVELYTCGVNDQPGALVGTQTTDANGNYSFSGLKPGDYMVKFISNNGTILSTANVGSDALDSDAAATASRAATRSPKARSTTPSTPASPRVAASATRCGWTPTAMATRTRPPAWPVSPCNSRRPAPTACSAPLTTRWCRPRPPMPPATTCSPA